jgi:primosomal protein N'
MFITTVTPIARGISKETLTYMSGDRLREGALVEVPLRKKMVKALVISSENARNAKLALKTSNFSLRKISLPSSKSFLPPWTIRIVKNTSDHYASTFGAALYALANKKILELENIFENKTDKEIEIQIGLKDMYIEGGFDFRMNEYRKIIEKEFSDGKSIVLLCPTENSLSALTEIFKKMFSEEKIISFIGKMPKKKFEANVTRLKKCVRDNEGKMIILTGSFLFILPENTSTIIIEEENSRFYKIPSRPFVNFTHIAKKIAEMNNLRLVVGDILLKSEHFATKKKVISENSKNLETKIVVLKKPQKDSAVKPEKFSALGKEIEAEINSTLKNKGSAFVFVPRKGHSPIVLCMHCGAMLKCSRCDSPVVLHKAKTEKGDNYFLCHHCGAKRSAIEKCLNCESWKLESFGIGIEKVREEVGKKWKEDSESVTIGSEKDVNELKDQFDVALIPSIDSLLALPDFNMDERLLRTILLLKEKTKRKLIIRTKHAELPLLRFTESENLMDFHQDNVEKRRRYGYAPFKTLIKITVKGKKDGVADEINFIKKRFEKWQPSIFPAFIKIVRNEFIMHALLKIDSDKWPDDELLLYLRNLSPSVSINVDPESLL